MRIYISRIHLRFVDKGNRTTYLVELASRIRDEIIMGFRKTMMSLIESVILALSCG